MDNYQWTKHSLYKLKQYGLSQQRVKRVIRVPDRVEEGIVPKTVACMQTSGSAKHPYEIWAMYQLKKISNSPNYLIFLSRRDPDKAVANKIPNPKIQSLNFANRKIRIISAWRYPGVSPKNNPIPSEILEEIKNLVN